MLATDLMRHVGELSDVTATQVKESRAEYRKASDTLDPFKRILDIYVSQWFGNDGDSKNKKKKAAVLSAIDFLRSKEAETFISTKEINKVLDKLSECDRKIAENALNTAKEKRFFHWELEFPEVFYGPRNGTTQVVEQKSNSGFDAVVGNPPYRDLKELDPQTVSLLFLFFKTTHNRANLYASFIEKALNLVRQEGQVSMIVPNSWTTQSSYINLKKRILHETHLHHLVRVPETAFPEQKVETIIFCSKTSKPSNDAETIFIGYRDDIQVQTIDYKNAQFAGKKFQSEVLGNIGTPWGQISGDADLLLKLDNCSVPLVKVCDVSLGLTPYDKYKGHTEMQIKSQVYHAKFKKDKTYKPLLSGGDISRYTVQWNGIEWISYGDYLGAPREQRFFTVPRILVKQIIDWTSRRIHAGYTSDELYNSQIAFNLIPLGPESTLYILSLLNSRLMNYYHRRRFLDAVKVRFQKILIQDAKIFPIHRINFITPINLRKSKIIEVDKLYADALTKQSAEDFFTYIKQLLFIKEILEFDTVHDLLVYLAEQMIGMHKQKHIETKRFLTWLEKTLNIQSDNKGNSGFDAITGKSSIEIYLGDYQKNEEALSFEGLMGIFYKNRSRIGISLSDNKIISNLKSEYDKSLAILLPLKWKLKNTDWLIDQIIYKLYGLTDEEIKIVEGKD
jgi:hypothetical protein